MKPIRLPYDEAVRRMCASIASGQASFVARVNTPWIGLGLEAWLRRMQVAREGVVLVTPNSTNSETTMAWSGPTSSPLVDAPNVTILLSAPRSERARLFTNAHRFARLPLYAALLARGSRENAPLDVVSAREPDVGFLLDIVWPLRQRRVQLHVLDEGFGNLPIALGTDTGPALTNARLRSGGNVLHHVAVLAGARARVASAAFAARRISTVEHNLVRWDVNDRQSYIDHQIRDSYREVIALRPLIPLPRRMPPVKLALLTTTPASDYLHTDVATESRIVDGVISKLVERGFDVVIKPHPREKPGKYKDMCGRYTERVSVLPNAVPAEQVFRSLGADDIVVGYTGQALLSASLLFGLPAYSLTATIAKVNFNPAQLSDYRAYELALQEFIGSFEELDRAAPRST